VPAGTVPPVRAVSAIYAASFFALGTALVAVGLASWRRTREIRMSEEASPAPPQPISARTSRLTWLAAEAGLAATLWGASILDTSTAPGLGLLAGGTFVTMTGLLGRVTHIHADGHGMTIRYAGRGTFDLAWQDLTSLHPPRTPLGGWRFQGRTGTRTLMPSDLWGMEGLLRFAVREAGLRCGGSAGPTRR
jgi:hypothetical protein